LCGQLDEVDARVHSVVGTEQETWKFVRFANWMSVYQFFPKVPLNRSTDPLLVFAFRDVGKLQPQAMHEPVFGICAELQISWVRHFAKSINVEGSLNDLKSVGNVLIWAHGAVLQTQPNRLRGQPGQFGFVKCKDVQKRPEAIQRSGRISGHARWGSSAAQCTRAAWREYGSYFLGVAFEGPPGEWPKSASADT